MTLHLLIDLLGLAVLSYLTLILGTMTILILQVYVREGWRMWRGRR